MQVYSDFIDNQDHPISIVTFKWKSSKNGYKLKNPVEYSSEHVNILFNSIKRNTSISFNFFCVTDDPTGINPNINVVNLWDKCKFLGGCYNRLYIFSKEMDKIFGNKILSIDLDCVITGNINNILLDNNDFKINTFENKNNKWKQIYNGALFLMKTGSRSQVWDEFDVAKSPQLMENLKKENVLIGSDQAWIQYKLGTKEKRFTNNDGIYDFSMLENKNILPENAKIVFFHGKNDPYISKKNINWVEKHWL